MVKQTTTTSKQTIQHENNTVIFHKQGLEELSTFLKIGTTIGTDKCTVTIGNGSFKVTAINDGHTSATFLDFNDLDMQFETTSFDNEFTFDMNIQDLYKVVTLNKKPEYKVNLTPDLNDQGTFDSMKLKISNDKDILIKEISLPIFSISNQQLTTSYQDNAYSLYTNKKKLLITVPKDLMLETIRDMEYFSEFNISFDITAHEKNGTTINLRTFSNKDDKVKKIKINWFENFHFQINNKPEGNFKFSIDFTFADLKKLFVSSDCYEAFKLMLLPKAPIIVCYAENTEDVYNYGDGVIGILAPQLTEQNQEKEQGQEQEQKTNDE